MKSPDVPCGDERTAAGSGAAAVPLNAPAGLAEPAGDCPGAAVSRGEGGTAAPDLPPKVAALIRREAYVFDAVGAPIARPPADIQSRLRFFHHINLTLEQIVTVLRSGRYAGP